jgi:hypothetical protein
MHTFYDSFLEILLKGYTIAAFKLTYVALTVNIWEVYYCDTQCVYQIFCKYPEEYSLLYH